MMEEHHINKKRKMEMIIKNNKELARKIILYCPAASKLVEISAREDQRLDLGTIARTFGLEPTTLKINGHFISRGVDLIASSVTWRSLLGFFSSKGLSTGTDSSGALVVDGKLSRCGTKRGHEPAPPEVDNRINCIKLLEDVELNQATLREDTDSRNTKKMKGSNNVCEIDRKTPNCSNSGLKRKNWVESINPLIKRMRIKKKPVQIKSQQNMREDIV